MPPFEKECQFNRSMQHPEASQKFFLNRRFWSFQGSYSIRADTWPLFRSLGCLDRCPLKVYVLSRLQRVLRRPLRSPGFPETGPPRNSTFRESRFSGGMPNAEKETCLPKSCRVQRVPHYFFCLSFGGLASNQSWQLTFTPLPYRIVPSAGFSAQNFLMLVLVLCFFKF